MRQALLHYAAFTKGLRMSRWRAAQRLARGQPQLSFLEAVDQAVAGARGRAQRRGRLCLAWAYRRLAVQPTAWLACTACSCGICCRLQARAALGAQRLWRAPRVSGRAA